MTRRTAFKPMALAVFAVLLLGAATQGERRYQLSPDGTELTAKVRFFGLASKTARFPAFSGEARLDEFNPARARIDVTIDARRIEAPDSITLKRLRGEKFFWVEKYPEVRFVGEGIAMRDKRHGTVEGRLTVRGITRKEKLDVSFERAPYAIGRGEPVRLDGAMEIDRRDYGMTAYRVIVANRVKIRFRARLDPVA